MVRVNYTGFGDAKSAFEALRPAHQKMRAMQDRLRPFSADYLVLDAALKALTTAAFHFTGDPTFYGLKLDRSPAAGPVANQKGPRNGRSA